MGNGSEQGGTNDNKETRQEVVYSAETKTYKPIAGVGLAIDPEGLCATSAQPGTLTINFLTPTRIYYNGSLASEPEFHILIRNLQRRVAHLFNFHGGIDTTQWDFFNRVIYRAKRVQIKDQAITWRFWERYSTRQKARIEMSGFVGRITYHGNVDPFVPLLKAGEVLHVGKGTTFGLGRYYIE
jgi:CRISPR-associated endoribonuclease Cas6